MFLGINYSKICIKYISSNKIGKFGVRNKIATRDIYCKIPNIFRQNW